MNDTSCGDTSQFDCSAFEDEFGLDTKSRLLEVYEWLEEAAAARESSADHNELDAERSG